MSASELRRQIRHLAGLPVRSDEVGGLLDTFLILAVVTILVVRIFLWATGYPQIGGSRLHIAHMLWGGLLMMVGIILMQSIITRWARHWGCVLGGIGFGLFIDELGKFITKDNNYFFRPTYAIIYVLFVVFYLLTRNLLRAKTLSPHEALVNAIEYVKEGAVNELNQKNKEKALLLLSRADPRSPFVDPIQNLLERVEARPSPSDYFWERWGRFLRRHYLKMVDTRGFVQVLTLILLWTALNDLWNFKNQMLGLWRGETLSFADWAGLGSGLISTAFILVGLSYFYRSKRLTAYRWFERALLISLLVNQVFVFVKVQLPGVFEFVAVLLIYVTLRYMILQEERSKGTFI